VVLRCRGDGCLKVIREHRLLAHTLDGVARLVAAQLRNDVGGELAPYLCVARAVRDGRADGRVDSFYCDDFSQELSGSIVTATV
jgi:hypothetical protein